MNIHSTYDHILKIIIIGDSGVGKSNFLFRFVENRFSQLYQITLGFDSKTKICTLPKSKKKVKLQLWDTAGQERYMSINKLFFQRVQGIILMYDITRRESYENLNKWVQLIDDNTFNIPVVLVGTKIDDEDENRIVRTEEGRTFAKNNGFLFHEASALNGKNVNNTIYDLSEAIISTLEHTFSMNISQSELDFLGTKDKRYKFQDEKCC